MFCKLSELAEVGLCKLVRTGRVRTRLDSSNIVIFSLKA